MDQNENSASHSFSSFLMVKKTREAVESMV